MTLLVGKKAKLKVFSRKFASKVEKFGIRGGRVVFAYLNTWEFACGQTEHLVANRHLLTVSDIGGWQC